MINGYSKFILQSKLKHFHALFLRTSDLFLKTTYVDIKKYESIRKINTELSSRTFRKPVAKNKKRFRKFVP